MKLENYGLPQRARPPRPRCSGRIVSLAASLATACGGAKDEPASAPPSPEPIVGDPAEWTLVLVSHRGPCSTRDPVPCHVMWTARPDGSIEKTAQPNDGGDAVKTTITLSPSERDELRALVRAPQFVDGMRAGFPCQGPGKGRDATITLAFRYPGGPLTPTRNIELCLYGADTRDSVPAKVEDLVRK